MITNDVQYRNTKVLLAQFRAAAENLEAGLVDAADRKLHQLQIGTALAQVDDLVAEVEEYDRLRSGETILFSADGLGEVSTLLIQGRIARGWSQRRLAERLGIAEQQIQRYESNAYATASLLRLCEIADALGLQISETAKLSASLAA